MAVIGSYGRDEGDTNTPQGGFDVNNGKKRREKTGREVEVMDMAVGTWSVHSVAEDLWRLADIWKTVISEVGFGFLNLLAFRN